MAKKRYWVVLGCVVSLLLAISWKSPQLKHPVVDFLAPYNVIWPRRIAIAHSLAHLFAFGIATTAALCVSHTRARMIQSVLLLLTIALLSETMQHWVYRIPLEWADVLDDCGGVLAGLCFLRICRYVNRPAD